MPRRRKTSTKAKTRTRSTTLEDYGAVVIKVATCPVCGKFPTHYFWIEIDEAWNTSVRMSIMCCPSCGTIYRALYEVYVTDDGYKAYLKKIEIIGKLDPAKLYMEV